LFEAEPARLPAVLSGLAAAGRAVTPLVVQQTAQPPQLNNLVVGNLMTSQASASFSSDLPASTLIYTASPLTEFSSPALTTDHRQALSGLAPGTAYRLRALAVTADLSLGALPDVVFTTAQPAQPGGVAQISAGTATLINDPNDASAMFAVLSIRNVGTGDAGDVTLTSLTAQPGWTFSAPLPMPLDLGALGRGASAVVLTRVVRTTTTTVGAAPLLTGAGSVTVPGANPQPFQITGTVPALYLTKSADLSSARPGDLVTFTVTAANRGLGTANGVTITDPLPAGLTFSDASAGGQLQNGVVVWPSGALGPGAAASLTLHARVAAGTAVGTAISNIAQASSLEIPSPISSAAAAVAVTAPPPPQLQLAKVADRPAVQPGQPITYTITLTNAGGGPATNVQVQDAVPAGTTVLGANPIGNFLDPTTVGWNLGTLAPGASTTIIFEVQVASTASTTVPISNVAQATAAEQSTPALSNQGNPVLVTVTVPPPPPPPQLSLSKSVDKPNVPPGGTLTYTLTYANTGSQPFTATILDPLPAGESLAGPVNGGGLDGTAVQFNIGTLAPGATGTVSFTVLVSASVPAGTTLTNQAQITGPGLGQPVLSNPVNTPVVAPTVPPPVPGGSSFAGTWSTLPLNAPAPATRHASLTVDAQGKFTVWARSQDGTTIATSAQGVVNPDGSFSATSVDGLVQFSGQISADHQTATIAANRPGVLNFSLTALRRVDVNALPAGLTGTFKGAGAAANGDQFQVRLSIDPGGNATVQAQVIGLGLQFATLQVMPNGVLISPDGNRQVGTLQAGNNGLILTYNYVVASVGYQNTFQVALAAGP
jgi:uncharacterized repeat protein (TIGR01451 family)